MTAPILVSSGAATHPGLRRRINEDAYLAQAPLFLVADGMGGHSAGDVASAAVVAEFGKLTGRESVVMDDMAAALQRARTRVEALATGDRPAGTTLTGVGVSDLKGAGYWLAINIGDSRTYRFADGRLVQISIDHSVVQELIDDGDFDEAERQKNNVITRAIGAGSDAVADYWMIPAERGDRVLVCSDGLSNELPSDDIAQILTEVDDPQQAAVRLVREAMVNGGNDNITAIVIDALEVSSTDDTHPGVDDESTVTAPRSQGETGKQ